MSQPNEKNGMSRRGFVPCEACGGRGRVPTDDLMPLARQAWSEHKGEQHYPVIRAIKRLRELADVDLRTAKDLIETVIADA